MIFVASSVSDEQGKLAAGLVAGPLLMGEPEDFPLQDGVFAGRLELLPVFSTRRVNDLAETMALLTAGKMCIRDRLGRLYQSHKRCLCFWGRVDSYSTLLSL